MSEPVRINFRMTVISGSCIQIWKDSENAPVAQLRDEQSRVNAAQLLEAKCGLPVSQRRRPTGVTHQRFVVTRLCVSPICCLLSRQKSFSVPASVSKEWKLMEISTGRSQHRNNSAFIHRKLQRTCSVIPLGLSSD